MMTEDQKREAVVGAHRLLDRVDVLLDAMLQELMLLGPNPREYDGVMTRFNNASAALRKKLRREG